MDNPRCAACGGKAKRNGRTKAGTQRWRCTACGASFVRKIDNRAKRLEPFLSRLLSKSTQSEMGRSRSSFKRATREFWEVWPIAPFTGEVHDVVFLDGIWVGRGMVVLIACTREHALARHLARSESAEAWAAPMARVPAPAMAVTDGGRAFAKAARAAWPGTRIQRCTFHAFCQVRRCTTSRPRLECGRELYAIAKRLLRAKDADSARAWLVEYSGWCARWERFLRELTPKDGRRRYVHERLRKARGGLTRLVNDGTLFTFVEMARERGGEWDSTNT